jgi:hypothetical protein
LRRLATTFCEEVIRLRAAYEALGKEIGIRTFPQSDRARLHGLSDAGELLRYLSATTTDRTDELRALFADMAGHHLAMMGAIVEGARATLARVDPASFIEGRRGLLSRFQDHREGYAENFRAVLEDDHAIQSAVFGPEFADAYAAARGR